MEKKYILFASEEDIQLFMSDNNTEDFEGSYKTIIICVGQISTMDVNRVMENIREYGDYCYISEAEYKSIKK